MRYSRAILLAGLLASGAASAAITYPVDVAGTAGQWAIWDCEQPCADVANPAAPGGHLYLSDQSWPRMDGGAIQGMLPRYRYLRQVRVEPPQWDARLQVYSYPCPSAPNLTEETLTYTCTVETAPPDTLHGAVAKVASERIGEALRILGFADPADTVGALGVVADVLDNVVVPDSDRAWLRAIGVAGRAHVLAVRARQAEIDAWIDAHPGVVPAISPTEWPPLPTAPTGGE